MKRHAVISRVRPDVYQWLRALAHEQRRSMGKQLEMILESERLRRDNERQSIRDESRRVKP